MQNDGVEFDVVSLCFDGLGKQARKHDFQQMRVQAPKETGEINVNLLSSGGMVLIVRVLRQANWGTCNNVPSLEQRPVARMLLDELAERTKMMKTRSVETSETELVSIKGFEGEHIEVTIEQLETKILPQSTVGFLD